MKKIKYLSICNDLIPPITVTKLSSDMCLICQQNNLAIMKSTYLQEANRRCFEKMRQITYNKLVGGITIVQCIDAEAVWDTYN